MACEYEPMICSSTPVFILVGHCVATLRENDCKFDQIWNFVVLRISIPVTDQDQICHARVNQRCTPTYFILISRPYTMSPEGRTTPNCTVFSYSILAYVVAPPYRWRGGATGRELDLRSTGRGFKSYSGQSCVTTLGSCSSLYALLLSPSRITWYRPRGQ